MEESRASELVVINRVLAALVVFLAFSTGLLYAMRQSWFNQHQVPNEIVKPATSTEATGSAVVLHKPSLASSALEKALAGVTSVRNFSQKPVGLAHLSQLLWAAYGVNTSWGERTVPSYKSAYPLRITLMAKRVDGLDSGIYRYDPVGQVLRVVGGLKAEELSAVYDQPSIQSAPVLIVISADLGAYQNLTKQFNDNMLYAEIGHVSQNIFLQAYQLGLGTVEISQFPLNTTQLLFNIPGNESAMLILPVGIPQE